MKALSLIEFSQYLISKGILDRCYCCGQSQDYTALGFPERANISKDGQIVKTNDVDDNVGIGLVHTVINSAGNVVGIRDGARSVYLLRCNVCGGVRIFDGDFIRLEFEKMNLTLLKNDNINDVSEGEKNE